MQNIIVTFNVFLFWISIKGNEGNPVIRNIPKECRTEYSSGSLSEPCGYCNICIKDLDNNNKTLNHCTKVSQWHTRDDLALTIASTGRPNVKQTCLFIRQCKRCNCINSVNKECADFFGACKCVCNEERYGKKCENVIPAGLSTELFADIANIFFLPYVYSFDFAVFEVYFYLTGKNLKIKVETEREILIFNEKSCKRNSIPPEDYCKSLFNGSDIKDVLDTCKSKPTYKHHFKNELCSVSINLAFPRTLLNEWNKKHFVLDYPKSTTVHSNDDIVAKDELLTISVYNEISNVPQQIFTSNYRLMVIYIGKSILEKCGPSVTIDKFSSKMYGMNKFARRQDITVTSSVVANESPLCQTFGKPSLKWFVWIITVNHYENSDPPFTYREGTSDLQFPSYSLWYGVYKVKHEVTLSTKYFSYGASYCYFKVVQLPLGPSAFGGSLRYIYYKSNLELITSPVTDPNFPLNEQPQSEVSWYCNDTSDRICQRVKSNDSNNIWRMLVLTLLPPFTPGKTYNFTMEVISSNSSLVEFNNQVIVVSQDPIPNLLIECLRNCGGKNVKSNIEEILYFRVIHSQYSIPMTNDSVYNWTYSTNNKSDTGVESIRQIEVTPNWILIINENSLETDQFYTFKVFGGGIKPGEAQITITTPGSNIADNFRCDVIPNIGTAGITKFRINCTGHDDEQVSPILIFYDKSNKDDQMYRLLCSSYTGVAENIILTRGQVFIFTKNLYGQSKFTTVSVTLSPVDATSDFFKESTKTLVKLSKSNGYEQKISYISAVGDILNKNKTIKQEAMELFLETLSKEKAFNSVDLELLLSTALSIICYQDNCTMPPMSQKSYQYLVEILSEVSKTFSSLIVKLSNTDSEMTSVTVQKLHKLLLICIGVLLNKQDEHIEEEEYNIYKLYKYGNLKTIGSLYEVNIGLAIRNLPYIKRTFVETASIDFYMKEDNSNYFTKMRETDKSFIRMSSELANSLSKNFSTVTVQTMDLKNNPYWWSRSDQVTTDVLSLNIGHVKRGRDIENDQIYTPIKILEYPIDIFLNKHSFTNALINGSVTQPAPSDSPESNDSAVAVYKIYPSKGSELSIKFLNVTEKNTFKVLIELNLRPDYNMIQEKGISITALTPWYNFSKEIHNEDDFVFIGILPASNVEVGKVMEYKFELQSARCQVWYGVAWSTSGCKVGKESTELQLHCQCNHLSFITGILKVPMNTVNPFEDYKLFVTIPENPYIFTLMISIFIIYIILLIWSCKKDREDQKKTNLIMLEDNISSDLFGYLLIVCTGTRIFAGTSSNIGIVLHGTEHKSRSHILRSSKRATLRGGSDDWFLLYAPEYLGVISSIQLWTDHSGPNPNWFCERIYVHDLYSKDDYAFVVDQWFGVTQTELCVEKYFSPITFEKEMNFSIYFITNAIAGFRESHPLISIVRSYPRSPILKSQRLSMAMVAVTVTLLTSLMFYNIAVPQIEDIPSYQITIREIVISVYSLIIAAVVTGTVAFAFKKSYVNREAGKISNIQLKKKRKIQVDGFNDGNIVREFGTNKMIYYFYKILFFLRQQDFFPMKSAQDSHEYIVIHKIRAVIAWALCMVVITVNSYLVILYGLKIGKVKSLLWMTSIGLSIGEDNFLVNPLKIIMIAVLFGIVEAQFCDMYTYDPSIHEIRNKSEIMRDIDQDTNIHELRLKPIYKRISRNRLKSIEIQQAKIQKWWTFIDIVDVCFPAIFIFVLVSWYSYAYYNTSLFQRLLFKYVQPDQMYTSLQMSINSEEFLYYIDRTILPAIYSTVWYNKLPLSTDLEAFKDTGWTLDTTHRILGVPRLRQIRVRQQQCKTTKLSQNLSIHCNVRYSLSTEDSDWYSAFWERPYRDDILFKKSPWIYHAPVNSSSITINSKSGQSFHGGGYIAELSRTQRDSEDIIFHLIDTDWLDWRTHMVLLEMTTYNVNVNAFSSIIFYTEFVENKFIAVGTFIMSFFPRNEYILWEMLGCLYGIFGMVKLIMIYNNIGPSFFQRFWTMYDLILLLIGLSYLLSYRLFLVTASTYIRDFQNSGKDTFFQFQELIISSESEIILVTILFTFITIRLLRLMKYGHRKISIKQVNTMFMIWSEILWITLVFVLLMLSIQLLLLYLMGGFFHVNNIRYLEFLRTNIFFYLPYCLLNPGIMIYMVVIIQGYRRASSLQKQEEQHH